MAACIAYSKLKGLSALPTLFFEFHGSAAGFFEFHGSAAGVAEQAGQAEGIAAGFNGLGFAWATEAAARAKLWQARHDAYWACLAWKPGHHGIATDAIVPISRLNEAILGAKQDIADSGLTAPIVGHVGDGNFHTVILVPPEPGGMARAWELDKKIVALALSLGGSCSGEHGIGIGKREFLEHEHGADALTVIRAVKEALVHRFRETSQLWAVSHHGTRYCSLMAQQHTVWPWQPVGARSRSRLETKTWRDWR